MSKVHEFSNKNPNCSEAFIPQFLVLGCVSDISEIYVPTNKWDITALLMHQIIF